MPRSGTVRILLFGALTVIGTGPVRAAITEFPYEAVVESDEALVWCGPGKQTFYPTTKLKRGDHVVVRRHDPGGWFMIEPPADSFSLLRVEDVERQGNTGIIRRLDQGQASVRIGSALDPTVDSIFQRKLSSGERVEILAEGTVMRKNGPIAVVKIRPPRGEFRWIEGMNLAPVDPRIKRQNDLDPFAPPSGGRPNQPDPQLAAGNQTPQVISSQTGGNQPHSHAVTANPVSLSPTQGTASTAPSAMARAIVGGTAMPADPRTRLEQIDIAFRDMVRNQPTTWNLEQIEQAYRALAQQSGSPAMRAQLDMRFTSIAHYKGVKAEYDDYFRLVSDTSRKDAELAALESSLAPQNTRPPIYSQAAAASPAVAAPFVAGPAVVGPMSPPAPPGQSRNVITPRASAWPTVGARQNGPTAAPRANAGPFIPAIPTEVATQISTPGANPSSPPSPSSLPVPPEPPSQGTSSGGLQGTATGAPSAPYRAKPNFVPGTSNDPKPQSTRAAATGVTTAGADSRDPRGLELIPTVNPAAAPAPVAPVNAVNFDAAAQSPQPAIGPPSTYIRTTVGGTPMPPQQIRRPGQPMFDGAGIVQRAAAAAPGGPRHVLLAPNGRILAYLFADGRYNLDAFLGQSLGIYGNRSFRPELQTDLIVVRGVMPVRLTP